jgi:hypothetical protein
MLEPEQIGVSWWLFFADGGPAAQCERELQENGFLTLLEHRPDVPHRDEKWLLRAARPFAPGQFREERRLVSAIVKAHGGVNEGSDSGWMYDMADVARYLAETG